MTTHKESKAEFQQHTSKNVTDSKQHVTPLTRTEESRPNIGTSIDKPSPSKQFSPSTTKATATHKKEVSIDLNTKEPLSVYKQPRKDAPTIGNPLMMRMDLQSKKGQVGTANRSHSGVETASRVSRNVRTVSAKSRQEEDFEQMSIEEIEVIIDKVQREIEQALDIKRRINKHKMMTKKIKQKKLQPVEAQLSSLRERADKLE